MACLSDTSCSSYKFWHIFWSLKLFKLVWWNLHEILILSLHKAVNGYVRKRLHNETRFFRILTPPSFLPLSFLSPSHSPPFSLLFFSFSPPIPLPFPSFSPPFLLVTQITKEFLKLSAFLTPPLKRYVIWERSPLWKTQIEKE